jgi:TonB family protein
MIKELSGLGLRTLYVPDSCDSSLRPNTLSSLFAFKFSNLIGKDSKHFAVLSRTEAHRFLLKNRRTDCDLTHTEVLAEFATALGVDSFLFVSVSSDTKSFFVNFSFRDVAGKELLRNSYTEPCDASTLGELPPTAAPSGWPLYFVGDGITPPKAIRMQNPSYPEKARGKHASGSVIISAVVEPDGKIDQPRVVQRVDPDLDIAALDITRTWLFEPAKTPDGTRVPVRVAFSLNFSVF